MSKLSVSVCDYINNLNFLKFNCIFSPFHVNIGTTADVSVSD